MRQPTSSPSSLPAKAYWNSRDYAARLGVSLDAFHQLRSRHPERLAKPLALSGQPKWLAEDIFEFEQTLRVPQTPPGRRGRKNTQERARAALAGVAGGAQ